jgi:hypothetical protein
LIACHYIIGQKFLPSILVSAVTFFGCYLEKKKFINTFEMPEHIIMIVCQELYIDVKKSRNCDEKIINVICDEKISLSWQEILDGLKNLMGTDIVDDVVDSVDDQYMIRTYYPKETEKQQLAILDTLCLDKIEKIGKGTFSRVFKICNNKKEYALKEMKEGQDFFVLELIILRSLSHCNVISLFGVTSNCKGLILELMNCTIEKYIFEESFLAMDKNFQNFYTLQLLTGLNYIHSMGCIHRDIKPSNILVKGEWPNLAIKYCDFGLSIGVGVALKKHKRDDTDIVTLWYRPPEILLGSTVYDSSIDVWSLMCTICELLLGKPLFNGSNDVNQLYKIFVVMGKPNNDVWPGVKELPNFKWINNFPNLPVFQAKTLVSQNEKIGNLISKGLTVNPSIRPSTEKLLEEFSK